MVTCLHTLKFYHIPMCTLTSLEICNTRMHSSRMHYVGCGTSAAVAVCPGGVVCLGGCLPRECVCPGGSAWGCLPRGVCPGVRGLPREWGVCLGDVSQHALRQTPHTPVDRMTDRCKNITLPQLSCGR